MQVETYNRETLLEMLHSREVTVRFQKVNGEVRALRATLKTELLPPKPVVSDEIKEAAPKKTPNSNLVTVWDLDALDWRSFRTDRIIEVI